MGRIDATQAEQVMRAAGCIPLLAFPGTNKPWLCLHEQCGQQISPLFANVRRRGAACRTCAGFARGARRRAQLADNAVAEMRAAGFEPLEPYPGSSKPWTCRHLSCGQTMTPSLNTIRKHGTACRRCTAEASGRRFWTRANAEAAMRAAGLEPLEPWSGSSTKPWRSLHLRCGRVVSPRLGNIAAGQGPCRECGQGAAHESLRLDQEMAAATMRAAGLEPVERFPGVDLPWPCIHEPCGRRVAPTYTNIKRGQGGCVTCGAAAGAARRLMPEEHARAVMAEHGLTPVEPYPGSNRPWRASHSCGRVVSPTLSNVASGKGICRYCNSSFDYAGPAMLYLVVDREALKVGCANMTGRRLAEHQRHGWRVAWTMDVPTGDDAYLLEQSIITWWRDELGLPQAYPPEMMPQYGYTETARWDDIHPAFVLEKAAQLLEELRLTGVVHPTPFAEIRPDEAASRMGARARARSAVAVSQQALDFDGAPPD